MNDQKERRRPAVMTPEIRKEFLVRVARGDRFKTIVADPNMPTLGTVAGYLTSAGPEPEAFREEYYRLRGVGWAQEIIDIANDCPPGRDHLARAKLRIQTRKQLHKVFRPDVYGRPKKAQAPEEHPKPFTATPISWSDLPDEARARYDARYPGVARQSEDQDDG